MTYFRQGLIKNLVIASILVVSLCAVPSAQIFAETPASGTSTPGSSSSGASSGDAATEACAGLTDLGVDCNSGGKSAQEVASPIVKSLINTFSIVVGAVAVVMMIVGGFRLITSGGDADGTKKARNTILYAALGLAVVVLAQSIVYFVFRKANDLQTPASSSTSAPAPSSTGPN